MGRPQKKAKQNHHYEKTDIRNRLPRVAPPDDNDFELTGVLSPEERIAESMKRAERDGDVIDLRDLADDSLRGKA